MLIRVKAFGLNRAELFTRQGHSPGVMFPRVLGIECVGVVEAAPGGEVVPEQTVAAVMGGMGRVFDGSYAEYTSVPAAQVLPLTTDLAWDVLDLLREMAAEKGCSVAQLALAWCGAQPGVTAPIIGPRTFEQVADNHLGARTRELLCTRIGSANERAHRKALLEQRGGGDSAGVSGC